MTPTPLPRRRFLQALGASALGASLIPSLEARSLQIRRAASEISFRGDDPGSVQALRGAYLLARDILYVNHASIGTIPREVHDARVALLALCEENPWLYMWGAPWEEAREDARSALAGFLGTHPDDLALTHNTTEGFNLLGNGLPLGPGDEVVYTSLNHAGASVTWVHNARRRGFAVRQVEFPILDTPGMSADDVVRFHLEALTPRTRVLAFPHVDNLVGIRHPMRALAAGARAAGVRVVAVDAAQSAGMIPVDLAGAGVDLYAGSPHKWLQAAKGLGFAYLSPSVRQGLEPSWVTWGQARWGGTVRRFEDYGTRNLAETVNLSDAVAFQAALGAAQKEVRYRALWDWMYRRVDASRGLTWRSPRRWEEGASLVAVEVAGASAPEVAGRLLREHGVVMRAFGPPLNSVRISPHLSTTEQELETLFRLLEEAANP
ncbi:MAG TPA: aminotransferase class V-fold PLP-dependent enzyme [Longimicrobiales bacterium]|nr:aminotransferase class V-fold PLP-dependent enzyme [Longimicrobiales bacterium]